VDDSAVHNLIEWLDRRIARTVADRPPQHTLTDARVREIAEDAVRSVIGLAVVPLLKLLMQSENELRHRLAESEAEMIRLRRVLREHEAAGSMGALDAMNAREFARHVAWLCRRDGCEQVTLTEGRGDTGADILGYTADGRRLVVRCKARNPSGGITSGDVRGFLGTAKLEHKADVALLVATAPFTRDALLVSARHEVTAVHRGLLEAWNNGAKLRVLE